MKHKRDSRAIPTTGILAINLLNKHGYCNGNVRVCDTYKNKRLEIKGLRRDNRDNNAHYERRSRCYSDLRVL